jgi:type VI secretion system protein ImpH
VGATVGRETDALRDAEAFRQTRRNAVEASRQALFASLADAPYRHDFYQTLRRLECLHDPKPRWGKARRPVDEPIRLGQDPDLSFAPAPLASFDRGTGGRPPRLQVRLFGLLGPNGPLPIHITEYARDRLRQSGDPTLTRFLDLFHHRFLALFYRAWAQAQPHVNHDRPAEDRFAAYLGAFLGIAPATFRGRDTVPDLAKFFHVGALIRHTRNAEGLRAILQHFFRVPVEIEQFVGDWMPLATEQRTYLGRDAAVLGVAAVAGSRIWDRQHKFRLWVGPLTLAAYESFLPGGTQLRKLVDWVRLYVNVELRWDVRLTLKKEEVPHTRLGAGRRLGWTTWLGQRRSDTDAGDLCLDAEAFVGAASAGGGPSAAASRSGGPSGPLGEPYE